MSMEMKRGRFIDDDLRILPPEIITEILYRLPADSAIGCRRICKQWRSFIDDPSFVDTHTRQVISSSSSNPENFGNYLLPTSSSGLFLCAQQEFKTFQLQLIEYNDDEERLVPEFKLSKPISHHPFPLHYAISDSLIISSCNGLVFMGPTEPYNNTFVCNPFTREYVNLGTRTIIRGNYKRWSWLKGGTRGGMTYGFGYHPCTNEYKVVSIFHECAEAKGHVSVYTFGSGVGWRNKGEITYSLLSKNDQPGFFVNGAIHWYTYGDDDKKIVSFDLADEEFKVVVPLPPPPPSPNYIDQLGVLGGCLCVTRSHKIRCKEIPQDVWILNVNKKVEEEDEEFSWNRKSKISIPWRNELIAEPYAVLKSGKILLRDGIRITSYDPKNEAFYQDESIFPDSYGHYTIVPYTKSFVSLKLLGEEHAKCFGRFVYHALVQQQQQQG